MDLSSQTPQSKRCFRVSADVQGVSRTNASMFKFPSYYVCTGCNTQFSFEFQDPVYYFGETPLGAQLLDAETFPIPVRPGWCKTCAKLCVVEDIQPLHTFEASYGAVRAGKVVEYPEQTLNFELPQSAARIRTYLRWRMSRLHQPRALCCGGTDYQLLDVKLPLLKHAECDFGVVDAAFVYPGSYNGPGRGVYSPANIPVFDGEGELIGLLTTRARASTLWNVAPAAYEGRQSD